MGVAALFLTGSGCSRPAEESDGRAATRTEAAQLETAAEGADLKDRETFEGGAPREEEREAREEERMRARAMQSLQSYRAPNCAAALAKLEELLRRGRGRWHVRTPTGGIPEDLVRLLADAELWRDQGRAVCAGNARFDRLGELMDAIWRYPRRASAAELESRLAVLHD